MDVAIGLSKTMNIVSNCVCINKGVLGSVLKGQTMRIGRKIKNRGTRGKIKGFSSRSKSRLRETLALGRLKVPYQIYGLCLTIPGDLLSIEDTRKLWHYWEKNYFARKYNHCAFIWRIELQERKQAHWHCVCYVPTNFDIRQKICLDWFQFLHRRIGKNWNEKTLFGALRHSARVDDLQKSSTANIIGYLADHTSKHKQAQLGWEGRQWAIVNKRNMDFSALEVVQYSARLHRPIVRQFRRLQKNLRKFGKYTGAKIGTNVECISHSLFGKDLSRFEQIVEYYQKGLKKMNYELTMCITDSFDGRVYTTSDFFISLEECQSYASEYQKNHPDCKIDVNIYHNGKLIYWG